MYLDNDIDFEVTIIQAQINFLGAIDVVFSILYVCYLCCFFGLPLIYISQVGIASRFVILLEQLRFVMKSHAFISTNARKVWRNSQADSISKSKPFWL